MRDIRDLLCRPRYPHSHKRLQIRKIHLNQWSENRGPLQQSAFLTTDFGTQALLERENSERIRKIAADRFESWLFQFYPQFLDLVAAAEARIVELGGSSLQMQGGRLLHLLMPLIGWKGIRRLQDPPIN